MNRLLDCAAVDIVRLYSLLTGHNVDVSVFVLVVGMIRVFCRDFQVCCGALDLLERQNMHRWILLNK